MLIRHLLALTFFLNNVSSFLNTKGNKNMQIFSYISKQTDCGLIQILEANNSTQDLSNFNEDYDIDSQQANKKTEKLLANLSSCLNDVTSHYSLFTTHFNSKILKSIFEDYFRLNEKLGTIYLKKPIDREQICLQSDLEKKSSNKRSLIYTNHLTDTINCNCKRGKCEMRLKFLAFKDNKPMRSSRNKAPGILNYQYHHQLQQNQHKNIILNVEIKDINDNLPYFENNYYYRNFSEQIGTIPDKLKVGGHEQEYRFSPICRQFPHVDNFEQLQSNMIPLERAIDKDTGFNAEISYTLVLFKNNSIKFIKEIENERDPSAKEALLRDALKTQTQNCNDKFELIETKLNNRDFSFDNIEKVYDFDISTGSKERTNSHQSLLFLKINTFFDREHQDVYNFILIANDNTYKEKSTEKYMIHNKNYMLIRLVITDLNDNSPIFSQFKYNFQLNEIIEYEETPLLINYAELLNKTCLKLKDSLRVHATDKDLGLNGKIEYKIIQQVHRKNSNYKENLNQILKKSNQIGSSLDPNSLFVIDKSDGSIYLAICKWFFDDEKTLKRLGKKEFAEITSLLDYELYNKHILVVEATDSSEYNPLQTFVTVEVGLSDLNDHAPFLTDFHSNNCAARKEGLVLTSAIRPNVLYDGVENEINITIRVFEPRSNLNFKDLRIKPNGTFVSARIVITGISELTKIGSCLGQFLINDLDTPHQNGQIKTVLYESDQQKLLTPNHRIHQHAQLTKTTKLLFTNLRNNKDRKQRQLDETFIEELNDQQVSTNEIFELFLNFKPDSEEKRTHEFILMIKDSGENYSFESYVQLELVFKDENDNAPKFRKNFYHFSIYEWFGKTDEKYSDWTYDTKKYCLGQIQAFDSDVNHENSFIYYEISEIIDGPVTSRSRVRNTKSNYKATDLFYVNQTSGIICVKNHSLDKFDREVKSMYNFRLTAVNKLSTPALKSSVLVEVELKDLNDNRPEFTLDEYTFFIPEKHSNLVNSLFSDSKTGKRRKNKVPVKMYSVGRVVAFDKDQGLNSQLKYFLQSKHDTLDYKSYFELNTKNKKNPFLDGKEITLSEVELKTNHNTQPTNSPRLFKIIDNIENIVYVNSTTGHIFLLYEFDRELITHIRFRIFVSDRMGDVNLGNEAVLSNSVPVVIELIDMNDSKPECVNAEPKFEHENTIRRGPQFAYSVYVNYSDNKRTSTLVTSYPIYQLECQDMDLGKNSELNFEIEKIYIKNVEMYKFDDYKSTFSLNTYMGSLTPDQKKILGDLEQTIDTDSSKQTYYLKDSQLFSIEPKSGLIYFNHIRNLWINNLIYQTSFFNNYFLILRIKVRDDGMISSENSYILKIRLCIHNYQQNQYGPVKYCDFQYMDDQLLKIPKDEDKKMIVQKLENIDEELKIYDYTIAESTRKVDQYYDANEYAIDSNEFVYDTTNDNIFSSFKLGIDKNKNRQNKTTKLSLAKVELVNIGCSYYQSSIIVLVVSSFLISYVSF